VKIVFDTNVLLAAFATRGLCETLFESCLAEHEIVLSPPILDEFREHLAGKFKLPAARVNEIVAFLKAECSQVEPTPVPKNACRDPDDLLILGTAIAAKANCIVTGDKDLLTLGDYERVAIVAPRALYDRLK